MKTRNLISILNIHPAFILSSMGGFVIAICWAILSGEATLGFPESLREQESFLGVLAQQLLTAKPWLAIAVGFTTGLLIFSLEKRRIRAALAEPANIEKLAQFYQLSIPERRKRPRDSWGYFRRPKRSHFILGYLAALVLGLVCRFSLIACFYSLFGSMALLYPEYRQMYQGVISRLTNADIVGYEVAREWQDVRCKARGLLIATALVVACLSALALYKTAKIALEDDTVGSGDQGTHLYAEEVMQPRAQIAIATVLEC